MTDRCVRSGLLWFLVCCANISAQTVTSTPSPRSQVTIDGSVNPELISDEQAFDIWLMAVSEPSNATPEQLQRMRAKLGVARWSETDTTRAVEAITSFSKSMETLSAGRATFANLDTTLGRSQQQQFLSQRDQLVLNAKKTFDVGLSTEGTTQFQKLLLHVKQHMVIGPGPYMQDMPAK